METTEETDRVLHVVMEKFSTHIYKNIWVKRCSEVKSWEIINGIKNKKKKKTGSIVVKNSASVSSTGVVNNDKMSRDKRLLKNICFNIVKKSLFSFIQNNINWTGLYKIGCSAGP
ncbi:hypothetical protein Glove_48g28 [Diversispora epigaea]|uniref:Uncharacterized protein n=1 Tax=Diversispora epigaea TaxID=1348612 RepID=A0A397JF61_9GLOM|nr:hypothetical protein Glove_48g28 [Diversispora epigaea]